MIEVCFLLKLRSISFFDLLVWYHLSNLHSRNELRIDLSFILTLFVHLVNLLLIILICKKLIVMFLNLVLRFLYCLRYRKYDVSNICHSISIGSRISLRRLWSSSIRLDLGLCLCEINCLKVWCLCLS